MAQNCEAILCVKCALAIGGSDSSGGAGISADLKAFSAVGVHGCFVLVATTAQNTQKVWTAYRLPSQIIEAQLNSIFSDIEINAVKTGMLYDAEVVRIVGDFLTGRRLPLVIDPVLTATVGTRLHNEDTFIEELKRILFPIATVVTPNIPEASIFSGGKRIRDIEDMKSACEYIYTLGCKYVLIKGGHLKVANTDVTDVLFDGNEFVYFRYPRQNKKLHGTGCTFASYIAGLIAYGYDVKEAVRRAREMIAETVTQSYKLSALDFIDALRPVHLVAERYELLCDLKKCVDKLLAMLPVELVPDVGMNFGFALPNAQTPADICAIAGRIRRDKARLVTTGAVEFGASTHIARIILTAMKFDSAYRSALNLKESEEVLQVCKQLGFRIGTFDRKNEPENVSTMEWGTASAIRNLGNKVPDIIYDLGSHDKEPMIRLLGYNPHDVLEKFKKIIERSKFY